MTKRFVKVVEWNKEIKDFLVTYSSVVLISSIIIGGLYFLYLISDKIENYYTAIGELTVFLFWFMLDLYIFLLIIAWLDKDTRKVYYEEVTNDNKKRDDKHKDK